MLAIAQPRDEMATVTLTVDLAGNCLLEENRRTESAKFSLGTIVWIHRSHRGTDRTDRFAEGTETTSQNGHYVRSDEKKVKLSLRTDIQFTLGVRDVPYILYPYHEIKSRGNKECGFCCVEKQLHPGCVIMY